MRTTHTFYLANDTGGLVITPWKIAIKDLLDMGIRKAMYADYVSNKNSFYDKYENHQDVLG